MITRVNIPTPNSPYFDECWGLYECAFPPEERRELGYHIETIMRREFYFDAIMDNGELIGVVGWWDFDDITYIEHLAILPTLRNGGYGRRVLSLLKQECKTILLEVEHPTDTITQRRIGFYEREGFVLNHHTYIHPPYRGVKWVNLLIMTYPNSISIDELERFKTNYFPIVHFRRANIVE